MPFKRVGAAALFLQTALAAALGKDEPCACDKPTVRYVVAEMPSPPANLSAHAEPVVPVTNGAAVSDSPVLPLTVPATPIVNATRTFTPITPPGLDCSKRENILPAANVSLYYGAQGGSTVRDSNSGGLVNLTLAVSTGAVALEYIDSVTKVDCGDDSLTVSFSDGEAYKNAFDSWSAMETLFMITNHLGNCDVDFERGFFKVDKVAAGTTANTIACSASKEQISSIAGKWAPLHVYCFQEDASGD